MSRQSLVLIAVLLAVLVSPAVAKTIRVASHMAETSGIVAHADLFSHKVNLHYPDQFRFIIFPNAQLGRETALINQIKAGTLEMVTVGSGPLKLDPRLGVFDLPWLFEDRAHALRAITGPLGRAVADLLEREHGLVVLGIYETGFRHIVNKVRPIRSPEDLVGLKLRVTGSRFRFEGLRLMGANPVPVPWSETFTALQTGVVDGAEATHPGFAEAHFDEVSQYLSHTYHVFTPSFLLASTAFFTGLSADQQAAFRAIGRGITEEAFAASATIDARFRTALEGTMTINQVDTAAFAAAAAGVYDTYIGAHGDAWIEMIRAVATRAHPVPQDPSGREEAQWR